MAASFGDRNGAGKDPAVSCNEFQRVVIALKVSLGVLEMKGKSWKWISLWNRKRLEQGVQFPWNPKRMEGSLISRFVEEEESVRNIARVYNQGCGGIGK